MSTIKSGSRVAIAAASFSIYAFQELREKLSEIDELRFIFTSPSFVTEKADKQRREFSRKPLSPVDEQGYSCRSENQMLMLSATPVNNRFNDLRNQLALAYEGDSSNLDSLLSTHSSLDDIFRQAQTAFNRWSKLSAEEQGDLKYRRDQLERLKEEVVDIEEMNSGVSIMDLGLNEFRLDLLDYMKQGHDIEHTPMGLHSIVPYAQDAPPGVIFVLKNRNNEINIDRKNRLHPFYMVYISKDSEVIIDHLDPKDLLDRMRHLCRGKSEPILELCRKFNAETRDGQRMGTYSRLLGDAISSLIKVKETSDLFSFLDGDSGSLFGNEVRGLDDFELICFLIIR